MLKETGLPVWVTLRSRTLPFHRLVLLGEQYVELGVAGVAYGFLDRDLEIDRATCAEVCAELGGMPWMFQGFDEALEVDRAWRDVLDLPGLDSVVSAGSTRGLTHGAEELIIRAGSDPRVAAVLLAAGGLTPDLVGYSQHAGMVIVADGTDAAAERLAPRDFYAHGGGHRRDAWRMLLDDALSRALGIPVD